MHNLILTIAKQIYAEKYFQKINIPDNILQQCLQFYKDFWKNNGQSGTNTRLGVANCKSYTINNILVKIKNWYKFKNIKRTFGQQLKIYFNDQNLYPSSLSKDHSFIYINVSYDRQTIMNIKHELQHYFQHMVVDQDQYEQFYQQIENKYEIQKKSQYITYYQMSKDSIFQLYKKSNNKDNFLQFYEETIQKEITDKQHAVYENESYREENNAKLVIQFLRKLYNNNIETYKKLKKEIIQFATQQCQKQNNVQFFIQQNNYHQLAWIITNKNTDKDTIQNVLSLLIQHKKFNFVQYIIEHNNYLIQQAIQYLSDNDLIRLIGNLKKKQSLFLVLNFILNDKTKAFQFANTLQRNTNLSGNFGIALQKIMEEIMK